MAPAHPVVLPSAGICVRPRVECLLCPLAELEGGRLAVERLEMAGTPIEEVCCLLGIDEAAIHRWRKRFGTLGTAEVREVQQLREDNPPGGAPKQVLPASSCLSGRFS